MSKSCKRCGNTPDPSKAQRAILTSPTVLQNRNAHAHCGSENVTDVYGEHIFLLASFVTPHRKLYSRFSNKVQQQIRQIVVSASTCPVHILQRTLETTKHNRLHSSEQFSAFQNAIAFILCFHCQMAPECWIWEDLKGWRPRSGPLLSSLALWLMVPSCCFV